MCRKAAVRAIFVLFTALLYVVPKAVAGNVHINLGEELACTEALEGQPYLELFVTAVDTSGGGDTIINDGDVLADATVTLVDPTPAAINGKKPEPKVNGNKAAAPVAVAPAPVPGALASAIAIDSGNGSDAINNTVTGTALASATVLAEHIAVNEANKAQDAATALAVGISSGGGVDYVYNYGIVDAESIVNVGTLELTVDLSDAGDNAAYGGVTSSAIGIYGGNGKDTIENVGHVTASAATSVNNFNVSVTGENSSGADVDIEVKALAVGIALSDGTDSGTENSGTVTAEATSAAQVSLDASIEGGDMRADIIINSTAVGIEGSGGVDNIASSGEINATAHSTLSSNDISVEFGQFSSYDAPMTSDASAIGIETGEGADTVDNSGVITVQATADTDLLKFTATLMDTPQNINWDLDTDVGGALSATAFAGGVVAGDANNTVANSGTIDVTATADADSDEYSVSLLSVGTFDMPMNAVSQAVGISGGQNKDTLTNSGTINATANSNVEWFKLEANAVDLQIYSKTSAGLTAAASAAGIDGDTSDDILTNTGTMNISSNSHAEFVGVSVSALSTGIYDTPIKALSASAGLAGGHGNDTLANSGVINVSSSAEAVSAGGTVSILDAEFISEGNISTETRAASAGISGGDGIDTITNNSGGTINATANAFALHQSASFAIWGTPRIDSNAQATADAVGIDTGAGDEFIHNYGDINATSGAHAVSAAVQLATAAVPIVSDLAGFIFDDYNDISVRAEANSFGVDSGQGDLEFTNDGTISASSTTSASSASLGLTMSFKDESKKKSTGKSGDTKKPEKKKDGGDKFGLSDVIDFAKVGYEVLGLFGVNFSGGDDGDTVADIGTKASSASIGVQGGSGLMSVDNNGTINTFADSFASTAEAKVTLGFKIAAADEPKTPGKNGTDTPPAKKEAGLPGIKELDDMATTGIKLYNIFGRIAGSDDSGGSDGTVEIDAMALSYAVGIDGGVEALEADNSGTINSNAQAFANSLEAEAEFSFEFEKGSGSGDTPSPTPAAKSFSPDMVSAATVEPAAPKAQASAADEEFTTNFEHTGDEIEDDNVLADMGTQAHAYSAGIMSNLTADNIDDVDNTGEINVWSLGEATSTSVNLNIEAGGDNSGAHDAEVDATSGAFAGAVGIATGIGNDDVYNGGVIDVDAATVTLSVGGSIAFKKAKEGEEPKGFGAAHVLADAKTMAISQGVGIDAGADDDNVDNTGYVSVDSVAGGNSASIAISLKDVAKIDVGTAFADTSTQATASSVGLEGGAGDDVLNNASTGTVHAGSYSIAGSASGSIQAQGDVSDGWAIVLGGALAMASTDAKADATALSGGNDADIVTNDGDVDAIAVAGANSFGVAVSMHGEVKGLAVGAAFTNTSTTAAATATGVEGGEGVDTVTNSTTGTAAANAQSYAFAESVSVSVQGEGKGVELQGAVALSNVTATSDAAGVRGAEGDMPLINEGSATGSAVSAAGNLAASVAVQGDIQGVGISAAFADTSAAAASTARGVEGGEVETVHSTGDVDAEALAFASANSASVNVQGDTQGVSLGGAVALSSSSANADAAAVEGGFGADIISNATESDTHALAGANSLGVAVGVIGEVKGIGAGVAFTNTSTTATATANGQMGAKGEDELVNLGTGVIDVDSEALAFAEAVSVEVIGDTNGIAAGGSLAFSAVAADADSIGQSGGEGADTLANSGEISTNAVAAGGVLGVGVTAAGSINGVGGGVAFTDTSTTTLATALGMEGGEGADSLTNTAGGAISASAESIASANSASVTLGGDTNGVYLSGAAALSSTIAEAEATGMKGGAGDAQLVNEGSSGAFALAAANSLSAAVGFSGEVNGLGVGVSFTDTSTQTKATAIAVDGSAQESVRSSGETDARAISTAFGESVSVDVKGQTNGITLGGALSFSATQAQAEATGVAGGWGADELSNSDESTIHSLSVANSLSASVTAAGNVNGIGAGVTFADTSTLSGASAEGQRGGSGGDSLVNRSGGLLDVNSQAFALGESVSVTVAGNTNGVGLGGALAFSSVQADSEAVGQGGGEGTDTLSNAGAIDADSLAVSGILGVGVAANGNVNGIGGQVAFTDTSAIATSVATGTTGGEGVDTLTNTAQGSINADAQAYSSANSASVSAGGQTNGVSLGGALSFSATVADADATGMLGTAGDAQLTNDGDVTTRAIAAANSLSAAVDVKGQVNGLGVGVAFTDTSTLSTANATGVDGSAQQSVASTGEVDTNAQAYALAEAVSVEVQSQTNVIALGGALSFSATQAQADAVGVEGGYGSDVISNSGDSSTHALSATNALSASIGVQGNVNGIAAGVPFADTSSLSDSKGVAQSGGTGDDTLTNLEGGSLTVNTEAVALAETVSVAVQGNVNGVGVGGALALSAVEADTSGTGLSGGTGEDTLLNEGLITVDALGIGGIIGVGVNVQGSVNGVAGGAAFADTSVISTATATGLEGGAGSDIVANEDTGVIDVGAMSFASANTASVNFAAQTNGLTLGGALAFSGTNANALATGLYGDEGDLVVNHGHVGAQSIVGANSLGVAVGVQGSVNGVGAGAAFVDTSALTDSVAIAIDGDSAEGIISSGTFAADAQSYAFAESVGVDVKGQTNGVTLGAALSFSGVEANTTAAGIYGSQQSDVMANYGASAVNSMTVANSLGITVGVQGQVNGLGIQGAFADTSTYTNTKAVAISSGGGADTIVNAEAASIEVGSEAYTFAETVSVEVQGQANGVVLGGALAFSSVEAAVSSAAIDGGSGEDVIANEGTVLVDSLATAANLGIAVGFTGQINGVAAGAAFVDTSANATINAEGILGGSGDDVVLNRQSGVVDVGAESYSFANSVGIEAGVQTNGVTLGGALTFSATQTEGTALGVDGGEGSDELWNAGAVRAESFGVANSFSASVNVEGQVNGVSVGAAFADTSTSTTNTAIGISGGAGADLIVNGTTAETIAYADSIALSESLSLDVVGWANGVAVNGAFAFSETAATSIATALEGGAGEDNIFNAGLADAEAWALSNSVSAAVNVQGLTIGVGVGGGAVDTGAVAYTEAIALSGGEGNDGVVNEATGTADAYAEAEAVSTSATVSVLGATAGVGVNAAFSFSGTDVGVEATALDGGDGDDTLVNLGIADAETVSITNSAALTVAVNGASGGGGQFTLGDASANGSATSTGLAGGAGGDAIYNDSQTTLDVDAYSLALAEGVSAEIVGASMINVGGSMAVSTSDSLAQAVGLDGGTGNDDIFNESDIDVFADSDAVGVAVSLSTQFYTQGISVGVAVAQTESVSTAHAIGIGGGDGVDLVANNGSIVSTSEADGVAVGVSFQTGGMPIGITAGAALAQSASIVEASSAGIEGGADSDELYNYAAVDSTSDATGTAVSVTVVASLLGATRADASSIIDASATALGGGEGADVIYNEGFLTADSEATGTSVAVTVDLSGGVSDVDASTNTVSDARGISGGAGSDAILNVGELDVDSMANSDATTVTVKLAGVSDADSNVGAFAHGAGVLGGDGENFIENQGLVTVTSTALGDATGANVTLAGLGMMDANTLSTASAFGLAGGADFDEIINTGALVVSSTANGNAASVGVTLAGYAPVSAGSASTAQSVGIDGGGGLNLIVSDVGKLDVDAEANNDTTGVSVMLAGVSNAASNSVAESTAMGILGGTGMAVIGATSAIDARATAKMTMGETSFTLAGTSGATGTVSSVSESVGIFGADDDSVVTSSGQIDVYAESTFDITSGAITLFGVAGPGAATGATTRAAGVDGGGGEDWLVLTSDIYSDAVTTLAQNSTNFTLAGAGGTAGDIKATSTSTGVDGGTEDDFILSSGYISSDALSTFTAGSGSTNIFGTSSTATISGAVTQGVGVDGGGGDDWLEISSEIDVTAISNLTQSATSFSLGGASGAGGTLEAKSTASAVRGGAGGDYIATTNSLDATAVSNFTASGGSTAIFGTSSSAGVSGAETFAAGIEGGAGSDCILSDSNIVADATSTLMQNSSSFSLAGSSSAAGTLTANSSATGIDGGVDGDFIGTTGEITAGASSVFTVSSNSTTIFGTSSAAIVSGSQAEAVGVYGGEGADWIENAATITATANSQLDQTSTTFTLGGDGVSGGTLTAESIAMGIAGGEGSDYIGNSAEMTVQAQSIFNISGGSTTIFGASGVSTTSGADTFAVGIDGGGANDYIENFMDIEVTSSSLLTLGGSSYAFGGGSDAKGTMVATTEAVGVSGGSGQEYVYNSAEIDVNASTDLNSTAKVNTTFGSSASGSVLDATTNAVGVDVAGGGSTVVNDNRIDVYAETITDTDMFSYTFLGGAASDVGAKGLTTATGFLGGLGVDALLNNGVIEVTSFSEVHSYSEASTGTFTSATSGGKGAGTSYAWGVDTGDSDDLVVNNGTITVEARTDVLVENDSEAGLFAGDADTTSSSTAELEAAGVSTGAGADVVVNNGDIEVTSDGRVYSWAYAAGATWTFDSDGVARVESLVTVGATGIDGGSGDNEIVNNGNIVVTGKAGNRKNLEINVVTCNPPDGEGEGWDPDEFEYIHYAEDEIPELPSTDYPEGTTIYWSSDSQGHHGDDHGIVYEVGEDDEWVSLDLTCTEEVKILDENPTFAFSNGNGFDGDGSSTSLGDAMVTVYGIKAGDGDNLIVNNGVLTVQAKPDLNNKANADGDAWGDATATSIVTAEANAYGIYVGNGKNYIENSSGAQISATAEIMGEAYSKASDGDICIWFFGWWCGGGGTAYGEATVDATAYAAGIEAGSGGNIIVNSGAIEAIAVIDKTATYNDNDFSAGGDTTISAFGIKTGDGDDKIINTGTIYTEEIVNDDTNYGIAISSGGGSDTVTLGDISSTTGNIALGGGADTLNVYGAPTIVGNLSGDDGYDTLVLHGEGVLSDPHPYFEQTTKLGAGTFTLPGLPMMEKLELIAGTLQLDSAYTFDPEGEFLVQVEGDGSCGTFDLEGNAFIDGDITIVRGGGAFIDGTKYDVIDSSSLEGQFSTLVMPDTPVLTFTSGHIDGTYSAHVDVASFTSVTSTEAQNEIATYLDSISEDVKGEMADAVGEVQGLSMEQFPEAFNSMNPDYYAEKLETMKKDAEEYSALLEERLASLRQGPGANPYTPLDTATPTISSRSYLSDIGKMKTMMQFNEQVGVHQGVWGRYKGGLNFGNGRAELVDNEFGSAMGFDNFINDNLIAGVATSFTQANPDTDIGRGQRQVQGLNGSVYTSYFSDGSYLDTQLTYGLQDYEDYRRVSIGRYTGAAGSSHSAQSYNISLKGGHAFSSGAGVVQPFFGASFQYVDEDKFEEEGAKGLGLVVYGHDTQTLSSDLGIKYLNSIEFDDSLLSLELLVDWNYSYNIFDNSIRASFAGAQFASFTVTPEEQSSHGLIAGGSISFMAGDGFNFSLNYRGEHRRHFDHYTTIGALLYKF